MFCMVRKSLAVWFESRISGWILLMNRIVTISKPCSIVNLCFLDLWHNVKMQCIEHQPHPLCSLMSFIIMCHSLVVAQEIVGNKIFMPVYVLMWKVTMWNFVENKGEKRSLFVELCLYLHMWNWYYVMWCWNKNVFSDDVRDTCGLLSCLSTVAFLDMGVVSYKVSRALWPFSDDVCYAFLNITFLVSLW